MARLMWIFGILLIAAAVALGVLHFVSASAPAGVDMPTLAILLVGGILALGLGSVIDALDARPLAIAAPAAVEEPASPAPAPEAAAIPEFDPRGAKPEVAEAAPADDLSKPTRETIQALEQARQKIEQAFEARKSAAAPAAEAVVEETVVVEEEAVADDGQLYVVEERVIRRHPARILSDGTVEAETAEGWMRFENLEHLDEYLDSMEPQRG